MQRLVETSDFKGLMSLIGEEVVLMGRFFYKGKLVGVNDNFVELESTEIVYDTDLQGKITSTGKVPTANGQWFIQTSAIESWGKVKK